MKNIIHKAPDELLAESSSLGVQATNANTQEVRENTRAIKDLHLTAKDKSVEAKGALAVVKSVRGSGKDVTDAVVEGATKTIRKLEEVKSAGLIANKLLKEIAEKKMPEPKAFPTKMMFEMEGVSVVTIKGDSPTDEHLKKLIVPLIPKPIPGNDYILTDKDKKQIAKSITVPVVEKVVEKVTETVIREQPIITNEIKEVAVADEPDEVVAKINEAKRLIDPKKVAGLLSIFNQVDQLTNYPVGKGLEGGGPMIKILDESVSLGELITTLNFAGAGVSASYMGNGIVTVTIPGGSGVVYTETPTGLINGANVTYTVLHTIGTIYSFAINGQFLHPTVDYSVSGLTITMVEALNSSLSGKPFTIIYS